MIITKNVAQMRRELHRIPELGYELPKTLEYINRIFRDSGCRVLYPCVSSASVYFDFGCQRTVAFRTDMDALAIEEKTGAEYSSQHKGAMHACGHDGHTAMLLALAQMLAKTKSCNNNILLLFQPAEETGGGAEMLVSSGILDRFNVSAAFAIHLWPGVEKGRAVSCKGAAMAGSREANVTFWGSSGHVSQKEDLADGILAAALFINAMSRSSAGGALCHFGVIEGGSVRNSVAERSSAFGTLRWLEESSKTAIHRELRKACEIASLETGCNYSVAFSKGYPCCINDEQLLMAAKKALKEDLFISDEMCFASDDFAYIANEVPSLYIKLGVGDTPPLHSAYFDFDDSILERGVELLWHLCNLEVH